MEIKTGETVTVETASFGVVKVQNVQDKTLHMWWTINGREKNGFLDIINGTVSNVPQRLVSEIVEKL